MELEIVENGTGASITESGWRKFMASVIPGNNRTIFERRCEQILCMTNPVLLTCFLTISYVTTMQLRVEGSDPFVSQMPYVATAENGGVYDQVWGTLANGFYILAYVIVLTCLFLFLYAKRYERTLYGILMGAFVVSISAFVGYWVYSVSTLYRIPVSSITFFFLMLNLNVAGLVVVYWKPLHQVLFADRFEDSNEYYSNTMNFFLLLESVALAWPFACFSEWTVLCTLVLLIIWDLFAVLTPCGPLALIMKINRERSVRGEDQFELPPGLVYHHRLFNLGTGDITFYSVLIARAALLGYLNALCCTLSLISGICLTVVYTISSSLAAVPALPIALCFGIFTFFAVRFFLLPFLNEILVHDHVYL